MFSQEDFESDDDDDVSDGSADDGNDNDDDEEAIHKDKEVPVATAFKLQHLNPPNGHLSLSIC
jgi:hypothetical protein